jgi:hypothetical protein
VAATVEEYFLLFEVGRASGADLQTAVADMVRLWQSGCKLRGRTTPNCKNAMTTP